MVPGEEAIVYGVLQVLLKEIDGAHIRITEVGSYKPLKVCLRLMIV